MESFHSVLKKEKIYLHTYQDSNEAHRTIFEYIEDWYNCKRIHSSIDYLTPLHNLSTFLFKALT
ncbi:MAG: IS3 family transposase [Lachnospiraceae bacterium]|nr:IS3 family transposase [Lachnospiraceae bacterium]